MTRHNPDCYLLLNLFIFTIVSLRSWLRPKRRHNPSLCCESVFSFRYIAVSVSCTVFPWSPQTVLVATVSFTESSLNETLSTLKVRTGPPLFLSTIRGPPSLLFTSTPPLPSSAPLLWQFAQRAKLIQSHAVVNEETVSSLELHRELKSLRNRLLRCTCGAGMYLTRGWLVTSPTGSTYCVVSLSPRFSLYRWLGCRGGGSVECRVSYHPAELQLLVDGEILRVDGTGPMRYRNSMIRLCFDIY